MTTTISGMMDGSFDLDAIGAYPTTLPSPRMLAAGRDLQLIHSPRQPPSSGFSKSLNPIYSSDHDTTTTSTTQTDSPPSSAAANHEVEGAHAAAAIALSARSPVPPASFPAARRHTGGGGGDDVRWEAIRSADPPLSLGHFRLLRRLGSGDMGSVYLVSLRISPSGALFAMKVMDKSSLTTRNKLARAETELQIIALLDHPFLPTLYAHFQTDRFRCLLMEYCRGGTLHALRRRQPRGRFPEAAARFYAAEVLLALEYLHMLGVVYRDLKPENVLVRETGHVVLSDFDLALRCHDVRPKLVRRHSPSGRRLAAGGCFLPRILPAKKNKKKNTAEFTAEPTSARSTSFVGTHEYLAPEIIRGDGHGSAVDWWTFGVFLYELLHGATPFKGSGNRATLFNVVAQPLRFPDDDGAPAARVSAAARDLIRGLLAKDPRDRLASRRGAAEVKQHPFFDGVNWALVRSAQPPYVPDAADAVDHCSSCDGAAAQGGTPKSAARKTGSRRTDSDSSNVDFEYF